MEPCKKIFSEADLTYFRKSQAYSVLFSTLDIIINKVKGIELASDVLNVALVTRNKGTSPAQPLVPKLIASDSVSKGTTNVAVNGVLSILAHLEELLSNTPPLEGERRFGNLACRSWHDKMNQTIEEVLVKQLHLTGTERKFVPDLKYYLSNAFGSRMRLDYGTGHELNFVAFIGGLMEMGILNVQALNGQEVLVLFAKYYDLARRLILDYNLEPAGSHGVWGLDDHFHFIYVIGAAQFIDDKNAPMVQQVLTSQVINDFKTRNFYVNAISFIFKIKQGPFNEHSPIIYDIHTTVSLWTKVLKGLLRMYEVEVLGKFPVVQHFWFGELYSWKDNATTVELPTNHHDLDTTTQEVKVTTTEDLNKRTSIPTTKAPWAMSNNRAYHLPKEREIKAPYTSNK